MRVGFFFIFNSCVYFDSSNFLFHFLKKRREEESDGWERSDLTAGDGGKRS